MEVDFGCFYVKFMVIFMLCQYPPDSKLHSHLINIYVMPTVCLALCRVLGKARHSSCITTPLPPILGWTVSEMRMVTDVLGELK